MNIRNMARRFRDASGLTKMAYDYGYCVNSWFIEAFDIEPVNGCKYSNDDSDMIICGIDDLTEYYRVIDEYIKFNENCKKLIRLESLKSNTLLCHDIINAIAEFL